MEPRYMPATVTQRSQHVNIIVNIDFPESWTEEQRSSLLGQLQTAVDALHSICPGPVLTVKKSLDTAELERSTTASMTKSTGACYCRRSYDMDDGYFGKRPDTDDD